MPRRSSVPEFTGRMMTELLDALEPRLRRKFLDMIDRARGELSIEALETMILEGRIDEAEEVYRRAAMIFTRETTAGFNDSAREANEFLEDALDTLVGYDQFNPAAVSYAAENELQFIREFSEEQLAITRQVVTEGVARGTNPREQAREIRSAIGLTERQQAAVENYRTLLEESSSEALARELRDRRFDPSVRAAIDSGEPLTRAQINKMVDRYRERFVKYRAEVIARTESLRAIHAGNEEMFRQAIESGDLNANQIVRTWHTADDDRVRDAHANMRVDEVGVGENFVDGDGNQLAFPGDPSAPPETTIQCRCVVATRLLVNPRQPEREEAEAAAAAT